jgi:hypothetical protein
MNTATVLCLAAAQFFCSMASAQSAQECVPMLSYMHRASLAEEALSFSVGADIRGQAGFAPAVVITFTVPAGALPVQFAGPVVLTGNGTSATLELRRAEYWLLGRATRAAIPVAASSTLESRDPRVSTLYRLFYAVPEGPTSEFTLHTPSPVLNGEAVPVPPLRFRRAEAKGGVVLCATQ